MKPFEIITGDALLVLRSMPDASVDCVVTSPPYWGLRDYGVKGQIGLEETPAEFVASMVEVFQEVRRTLKPMGTCWVNLGDCYAGKAAGNARPDHSTGGFTGTRGGQGFSGAGAQTMAKGGNELKPKDLVGIPWRVALALQSEGWYLRSDIIWHKPNPMPESAKDRPTKSHEYLFLLTKSERYHYDGDAIREAAVSIHSSENGCEGREGVSLGLQVPGDNVNPKQWTPGNKQDGLGVGFKMASKWTNTAGRNKRTVWTIATQPSKEAHFATFPEALVEPCILAGCPEGGLVLDPFAGSGTTGIVAMKTFRRFVGIELNPAYAEMAARRIGAVLPGPFLFGQGA